MLKELREQDPMLSKLRHVLEQEYSKETVKSYVWHAGNFRNFCEDKGTDPKRISQQLIENYLSKIAREVDRKEKSRPYFLQACTSLELLLRTVLKNPILARSVPRLRKKVS